VVHRDRFRGVAPPQGSRRRPEPHPVLVLAEPPQRGVPVQAVVVLAEPHPYVRHAAQGSPPLVFVTTKLLGGHGHEQGGDGGAADDLSLADELGHPRQWYPFHVLGFVAVHRRPDVGGAGGVEDVVL